MDLILACPTYGPTEPDANRSLRVAIMHASRHGHSWLGDASPNRQPFWAARDNVVNQTIQQKEHDDAAIVWVDSDVILPEDAITKLGHSGYDFVTGIYVQRHPPHWPLIANFNGQSFNWLVKWPKNAIAPVDGCGFGICLTSIKMLRKLEPPWFEYIKFSEDFDFCLKCKSAGFQLYVDTSILCGHLMDPHPAGLTEYMKANPKIFGGNENGTADPEHEAGDMVLQHFKSEDA